MMAAIGLMANFDDALALFHAKEFDVAILDLNLNGTVRYPIAKVVRGSGIPVIFATGYGADGLLEAFRDCPTLQKPFSQSAFAQAVAAACAVASSKEEQSIPLSHMSCNTVVLISQSLILCLPLLLFMAWHQGALRPRQFGLATN
jgi:DNA-binding NtrC family response regulator